MTTSSGKFVGIDVAKDKLDIAVLGEKKESQVANDEKGITSLVKKMQKLAPDLIVVEATGGYQRAVVLGLYEAELPVAVVNPARVRQYARACGLLAKTDKLDAFNLAEFGKQVRPRGSLRQKVRQDVMCLPYWCVAGRWKRCSRQKKAACERFMPICGAPWSE